MGDVSRCLGNVCPVSSEVHLVQNQLTQSENDNAALRADKGKLENKAGQLVRPFTYLLPLI